jgi:hypothetical protein
LDSPSPSPDSWIRIHTVVAFIVVGFAIVGFPVDGFTFDNIRIIKD